MPSLATSLAVDKLARLLLYGPAKSRKTWWAGTAAEAGFKVLLLDGDGNSAILKNLTPEAQSRIYILDVADVTNRAVYAEFTVNALSSETLYWNEKTKKHLIGPRADAIRLSLSSLDSSWVVILDSYTALVWSLNFRYALENQIDLSDAKKTDWDGYAFAGKLATWIIDGFKHKLNTHFIMIAHASLYEKRSADGKSIESTRIQPKSTSAPHAMTISKDFQDIFYFETTGSDSIIETASKKDRDGGTINVKPGTYKFGNFKFKNFCEQAGIVMPESKPEPDIASYFAIDPEVLAAKAKRSATLMGGKSNKKVVKM